MSKAKNFHFVLVRSLNTFTSPTHFAAKLSIIHVFRNSVDGSKSIRANSTKIKLFVPSHCLCKAIILGQCFATWECSYRMDLSALGHSENRSGSHSTML